MKDLITVAKFTAKEMIKRKSFLISNIIIILIIIIGFNIPNIMDTFKEDDNDKENILVIDTQNLYGDSLQSLNQMELGSNFEISNKEISRDELNEKILNQELEQAIIISKNDDNVNIEYIVDSLGMGGNQEVITQALSEIYKNIKLSQSGLNTEEIAKINQPINMNVTELKEGSSGAMLVIAMVLSILLFYAIYFCAYQVSSSITTEKTSKIMETLVTSTTPKTIVVGKTTGIGLVGLLQVIVIVVVAFISYKLFIPTGMLDGIFDFTKITPIFILITLLYFILGYILYAFLYALTGSTVSKPEDINSANSPVAIIAVIGFYLSYFSMMNPTSSINSFASIFPFSAPFSMPFRIIGNTATITEIIISLIVLLLTIIIIANIAIKIYSSAILHYGTKLSIKDIFKMYKDKSN